MTGHGEKSESKDGCTGAWLARAVASSPAVHYVAAIVGQTEGGSEAATALQYISENAEAVTGLPVAAYLDDPALHFRSIHVDDRASYLAGVAALARVAGHDQVYRLVGESGAELWVLDSLRLIDGAGEAVTFAGCMIDITEQRERESALREEQALVRRALESAPVPISVTRLRDRFILYESPAMSAIFLEDESNRATRSGTHDRDPSQRAEYLRRIAEEGAVDNFEIDFRRLDGSHFTGAVSGRRIDYGGEDAVVAVTIDSIM